MREESVTAIDAGSAREDGKRPGEGMGRRYPIALVLYAVLAALSWFTLEGKVFIMGKPVELRMVPLIIIGGLALRTVLAMQAEKIRHSNGR
jgi:hypothetical protein